MVGWPTLPDGTAESIAKRWPERAYVWAKHVEAELRELCSRYDATPRGVLPARYGFVVAVTTPQGCLVLRSSPDPDASTQADVAIALADLGVAPVVYETIGSEAGFWTVMDEVQPGVPLALMDRNTVDLGALAEPFAQMNNRPAPRPGMPSVFDWLRHRLEDDNLTELPAWREPAPTIERVAALAALDELARTAEPSLCHGDASTWNLLTSGRHHWKLIDPRGVSGEVAYDVAVAALKLRSALPPEEAASRLSKLVGTSPSRVADWMFIADAARV
ncbi:phosphotransferase [Dactylosporangium sp. CA-152071]